VRQIGLFLAEAEKDLAVFPGRRLEGWDAYLAAIAFGETAVIDHLREGLRKVWEHGVGEPNSNARLPNR